MQPITSGDVCLELETPITHFLLTFVIKAIVL